MLKETDALKYKHSSFPVMAHEVGHWSSYPDFGQLSKLTGTLKPYNYERFQQSLAMHRRADQNKSFARASGKLAVELYKNEIEGCLRTSPYGGFQVLESRYFPGEGTAIIGWLDAFWDSKGLITPPAFRKFCAPVVCLLRMSKRIYTNAETFTVYAGISNDGPNDVSLIPAWKIEDEKGKIVASGKFSFKKIKTGGYDSPGLMNASLSGIGLASKLAVTVMAAGFSNSWNIWVYPGGQTQQPKNVRVAYHFDAHYKTCWRRGKCIIVFFIQRRIKHNRYGFFSHRFCSGIHTGLASEKCYPRFVSAGILEPAAL